MADSRRVVNGYRQYKGKRGWKFTHRYIAEQKIGRKLKRGEQVHHNDRNKRNNTFPNLDIRKKLDHEWEHKEKRGLFSEN